MGAEWKGIEDIILGGAGPAEGVAPAVSGPPETGLGTEWGNVVHQILHPFVSPRPGIEQTPQEPPAAPFKGARGSQYYGGQAVNYARMYGIPESLFQGLIDQETGGSWNPASRGGSGEIGLTQIMPSTAKGYGVDAQSLSGSPALQMQLGARILRDNFNQVKRMYPKISDDQAWNLALAGYNAGMPAVESNKVPESTLQSYVPGVRGRAQSLYGGTAPGRGADPSQPALWRYAYGPQEQQSLRAPTDYEMGKPGYTIQPTLASQGLRAVGLGGAAESAQGLQQRLAMTNLAQTPTTTPGQYMRAQTEPERKIGEALSTGMYRPIQVPGLGDVDVGMLAGGGQASREQVARMMGGPSQVTGALPAPLAAARGFAREAIEPFSRTPQLQPILGEPGASEQGSALYAERVGEAAGFLVGLPGKLFGALEAVMPGATAGAIGRFIHVGGPGALWGALTEIVDNHKQLLQMPPDQAAARVLAAAGLSGAGFGALGVMGYGASRTLLKLLELGGPEALNAFIQIRDAINPFRVPEMAPIKPGEVTGVLGKPTPLADPEGYYRGGMRDLAGGVSMARKPPGWAYGSWAHRMIEAGGPMGVTPAPVQALGEWMDDINKGFESIWRAYAPREAATVSGKPDPIRAIADMAMGERESFIVSSSNQWEGRVRPRIDSLSRIAGDKAVPDRAARRLADNVLRGAITMYFDRMGDPQEFDKFIQDAMMKDPRIVPYVERMNRFTPDEKALAEAVRRGDLDRAAHGQMHGVLDQYRDWHVSHVYEPRVKMRQTPAGPEPYETTGQGIARGASRLNPRYRAAGQQTYKTLARAIAEGDLKPKTLDIIALNKMNDMDMSRAIMARQIRDAIVAEGAGGWYLKVDDAHKAGHTVDLGDMRIFRKIAPIMAKGPGEPGEPEYFQKLKSGATKPVHPQPGEMRFYTTPEVNQSIKWMYERDPFMGQFGEGRGENFLRWLSEYNSYMKAVELAYSVFHDFTLAKVYAFAHPFGALRGLGSIVTSRSLSPYERWGPVARGIDLIRTENPIFMKLVKSGLMVNTPIDAAYLKLIHGDTKWGENMLLNKYVRQHHHALFEVLQPALKAVDAFDTFNSVLDKWQGIGINPKTRLPWTEDDIAERVASLINDRYGGLNWDRMGTTKMMRTVMRSVMLAPDWTTSNIRFGAKALGVTGASPFKWVQIDMSPRGWTRWFAKTPEVYLARQALIKSAVSYMALLQGASYLITGMTGRAHSTFENDGGRWWMVEMPWSAPDGRKLYVDALLPGELRDLVRITGNLSTLNAQGLIQQGRSKLSPMASGLVTLFGQTDYAGRPYLDPGMTAGQKLRAIAEQEIPRWYPPLSPIGIQPLWQYVNDPTEYDLTTTFFRATGFGQVQRGALVPATSWHSLPPFNKRDFLSGLDKDQQSEFSDMLETGRITGEVGEKFQKYLEVYHYNLRQEVLREPPDVRYRPLGVRGPRHQISVYGTGGGGAEPSLIGPAGP